MLELEKTNFPQKTKYGKLKFKREEIAKELGLSRSPVGKVLTKAFKDKTPEEIEKKLTFAAREFKEKTLIGLHGLGCVTHPEFIRNGNMTGFKTGLYEVEHSLASFEVRDPISHKISETLLHTFKI